MVDTKQYDMDLALKLRSTNRELTLSTLRELAQNGYRTDKISGVPSKRDMVPAGGFYLTSILRQSGYNALLSHKCDAESLRRIASENPFAVCLSTTMILSTDSVIDFVQQIRKYLPDVTIIVGGVYVWKSYQYYEMNQQADDLSSPLLFNTDSSDIEADVYVVAPHGRDSLLRVLKELERGHSADFTTIANLALPDKTGRFIFTTQQDEQVDYNTDFTRWDLIDELPEQIPIRTSIGCPYRCRFCDFYQLYPKIFLRSTESLRQEMQMIRQRIGNGSSIVHATDDNVFITPRRVQEVTGAIISSGLQRWIGFMRASAINESTIGMVQHSGLLLSLIGVESGDRGQLERMNKRQRLEDVKRGIELLDHHGISVVMTFIVGFPGETAQTIRNTAGFLNDLDIGIGSSGYLLFPLIISPFSELAKTEFRKRWNITGSIDKWEHATMKSSETEKYGYDLFKQVINIPYHYTEERTFYNREIFNDTQRKKLFTLRQRLTVEVLQHSPGEKIKAVLSEITHLMGFPATDISKEFLHEISK
jgi:radical SAM superfamily enzyme YgiQ (UPF0313 family)